MDETTEVLWEKAALAFRVWAARHPSADRPFMGVLAPNSVGFRRSLSPLQLADEVARRSPLGQQEVRGIIRVARARGVSAFDVLDSFSHLEPKIDERAATWLISRSVEHERRRELDRTIDRDQEFERDLGPDFDHSPQLGR